jgi:hypothetical protein
VQRGGMQQAATKVQFANNIASNNKSPFIDVRNRVYNSAGKILIVDDEKFNCDIIDGFLMILGIQNR